MTRRQHQSGFALLMLLVVLLALVFVGLASVLGTAVKQQNEERRAENRKVLLEAKEALLGYAVNYAISGDLNDMGRLPCPDYIINGSEGNADGNCGGASVNAIGYFPFKSVGRGKIVDSSNECLWYVVSGDYKTWVESDLLNWDTLGYLNLVDEFGNLKHGVSPDDYPIAFIISPGDSLGQTRAELGLPQCQANYTRANYLEGPPSNADYSALLNSADTLWDILTTSESSFRNQTDFNDQVIAIYRNELWDRIKKMESLSFDISAGVAATSSIEKLTKSLAECIAEYGNEGVNPNRLLPFPAPIDIQPANSDQNEYRVNSRYDDDALINYGRFPQRVNALNALGIPPPQEENDFVAPDGSSYCDGKVTTPYDADFWENWKDHFFYIVSTDFDFNNDKTLSADNTKCDPDLNGTIDTCITVDNKTDKVAAMVIFAGPVESGKDRVWWWDEGGSVAIDNKSNKDNYLEGDNQTVYTAIAGKENYNTVTSPNDYSYCIEYNNTAFTLSAVKCADL